MRIIKASQVEKTPIAIVVSRYHESITEQLLKGCVERLQELEVGEKNMTVVYVPGCVEIPLAAQRLAKTGSYSAVIALGLIIEQGLDQARHWSDQVAHGCQKVMLAQDVPVIFGVLTTENEKQAEEYIGGDHGHKGRDAADAAIEMVSVLHAI